MINRMTDTPPEQSLFYTCAGAGSISNDFTGKIAVSGSAFGVSPHRVGDSTQPKHKQP